MSNDMNDYTLVHSLTDGQVEQLHALYQRQWWSQGRTFEDVRTMLANSSLVFSFVEPDSGRLVAFCRLLTDFAFRGTLHDVIVDEAFQRQNGSVRFISENIDYVLWINIGDRDDGRTVGEFQPSNNVLYPSAPPADGKPIRPSIGQVQAGKFTLSTFAASDGAMPGEYKVSVESMDKEVTMEEFNEGKRQKSMIPKKYSAMQTSGLTATIPDQAEPFQLTLELKD